MREDILVTRANQAIAALARSSSDDLSTLKPLETREPYAHTLRVDPNEGVLREDLFNEIALILTAIGSLKDYLNSFCAARGISPYGDSIINNNIDVALVHDLWNIDKHYELRKPRSGSLPHLRDIRRVIRIRSSETNAVSGMSLNPVTGELEVFRNTQLELSAMIYDDAGNFVADFRATCERAIDVWVAELIKNGVSL